MLGRAFLHHLATCAGALTLALASTAAHTADVSPWDGGAQAAVRLIAGGTMGEGAPSTRRAGLEIRLKPGWKTYWRYPGEAGIPPRFDFTGSQNVEAVHVAWPAPVRFSEGGTASIGYTGDVIFPLAVTVRDTHAPAVLRAKVDYAVCDDLCMPAEGKAEVALERAAEAAQDKALRASEARVPRKVGVGAEGPLAVAAITEHAGPPRRILVDVKASGRPLDLFVEGPDPGWSLPLPEQVPGAPSGLQRFAFDIDGAPKDATLKGAALTLTATAGDDAIETTIHLD